MACKRKSEESSVPGAAVSTVDALAVGPAVNAAIRDNLPTCDDDPAKHTRCGIKETLSSQLKFPEQSFNPP